MAIRSTISETQYEILKNGNFRYHVTVRHAGLHKFKEIKDASQFVATQKAAERAKAWNEQWERQQSREGKKERAARLSAEEAKLLDLHEKLLQTALTIDHVIDWKTLEDYSEFPVPNPQPPKMPARPEKPEDWSIPPEPTLADPQFQFYTSLLDLLIRPRLEAKKQKQQVAFQAVLATWSSKKERHRTLQCRFRKRIPSRYQGMGIRKRETLQAA